MIKRMIRQMLTAQIFSALAVSVCLLIDNIMIGRFLGLEALAAYGLANPLLLAIGAIASMLAVGVQARLEEELSRARADAAESRMRLLSGQIHPQFIFNSLNAIKALIVEDLIAQPSGATTTST